MQTKRIRFTILTVIVLICSAGALLIGGCGGGSGTTDLSATLTGIVYAPDGTTPVADALVYVPDGRATAEDLPEEAVTWTSTGPDGSFTLSNVPSGTSTVVIIKDEWTQSFEVNASSGESVEVPRATTTLAIGEGLDTPPGLPFDSGDPLDIPPSSPDLDKTADTIDLPPPPPY